MDLLFRCLSCRQYNELPYREAGQPQTCAGCKRPMQVPAVSPASVIIPDPDPARVPQHALAGGMSLAAPQDGFAAAPTFNYPQEVFKLIQQTTLPTTRIRNIVHGIPVKWVHELINATLGPIATEDNVMLVLNHAMMGNWPSPAPLIVGYQLIAAAQAQAVKQQGMFSSSEVAAIILQLKTGQTVQWTLPKGDANSPHWLTLLNQIGKLPLVA